METKQLGHSSPDIAQISANELFSAMEELLAQGRQAAFVVTGMSMWPLLCHGRDRVVVEGYDPNGLHKGDIVLLQTPQGNYLLHRITEIRGNQVQTTGDGNCFRDGFFPRACVKARVVQVVRRGKVIPCSAFRWRLVFALWMGLYPFRGTLLSLLRRIGGKRSHANP